MVLYWIVSWFELGGSSEDSSAYSWANEEQPENQERRKGLSTVCISMRMFQYFFTCLYTEKVYWKKSCLVVYICCVNVYPRNCQTFYSMYVWIGIEAHGPSAGVSI